MNSDFTILYGGGKKLLRKIQAVPSVEEKHRCKYDVWEKGVKKLTVVFLYGAQAGANLGSLGFRLFSLLQAATCTTGQLRPLR